MSKLVLVTGGSRSGKSDFAEQYVLHSSPKCAYIATAEILDDEMAERVRLHQKRRANGRWINFEAPYEAEKVLENLPAEVDAALFDCLTMYMSNLFYGKGAVQGDFLTRCNAVFAKIDLLLHAARESNKTIVFVTNEVGSGIVPDNQMAREYRDLSGWVNQRVAAACDQVFLTICGQAVDVKKLAYKFEDEVQNV